MFRRPRRAGRERDLQDEIRDAVRAHEMTIRMALGAGRGRLMHQLVVGNLMIAGLGGMLGVALARRGMQAILATFPANFPLPRAQEIAVDYP